MLAWSGVSFNGCMFDVPVLLRDGIKGSCLPAPLHVAWTNCFLKVPNTWLRAVPLASQTQRQHVIECSGLVRRQ
jgi:hypothetical protein